MPKSTPLANGAKTFEAERGAGVLEAGNQDATGHREEQTAQPSRCRGGVAQQSRLVKGRNRRVEKSNHEGPEEHGYDHVENIFAARQTAEETAAFPFQGEIANGNGDVEQKKGGDGTDTETLWAEVGNKDKKYGVSWAAQAVCDKFPRSMGMGPDAVGDGMEDENVDGAKKTE